MVTTWPAALADSSVVVVVALGAAIARLSCAAAAGKLSGCRDAIQQRCAYSKARLLTFAAGCPLSQTGRAASSLGGSSLDNLQMSLTTASISNNWRLQLTSLIEFESSSVASFKLARTELTQCFEECAALQS